MPRVDQAWLIAPETQAVFDALEGAGGRAWCVGGCVRDALMDRPVADVDFATTLRPHQVMDASGRAGLRVVPTGVDHGTVTIVSGDRGFEVTTLRRDIATDGRRAVVAFADDPREDAARRDFTLNALYADRTGRVLDPLGTGIPDLESRRIRFIGRAEDRIREDHLRSLRYFRFFATHADPGLGFDPEALAAISVHGDQVARLSRERIGHEILRTLSAPDPAVAMAGMDASGVLNRILPGAETRCLAPLVHAEGLQSLPPDPVRRLAVLGGDNVTDRLRLSQRDAKALAAIRSAIDKGWTDAELGYRLGAQLGADAAVVRAVLLGSPPDPTLRDRASLGAQQVFPVSASDLMPAYSGPALGEALRRLEKAWIGSGFRMTKDDLLATL